MPITSNSSSIDMDDGWDWPWIYYAGTVVLKMPANVFWKTTPRMLKALLDVHAQVTSGKAKQKEQMVPIDYVL